MLPPASVSNRFCVCLCTALLVAFAAIAWLAAESKSPAYDEPYHAISSWVQLRYQDFRLDSEDPPLWQYWASVPNGRGALTADFDSPYWKDIPETLVHQWYWGVQTLYRTAGNNPVRLISHCRAMMLIVALLLGVLICYWAWQIGGPVAAVVATTLFCLDPNFLAHSALMKNDVAFAMSMFALAIALWKAGQKLDAEAVAWIALLSLVTLTIKFSGMIAVMSVPLLLMLRALMPMPWMVMNRAVSTRLRRLGVAASVTLLAAVVSYAGIWAVYGFRFRPTPEKGVYFNFTELVDQIRRDETVAAYHGSPPPGAKPADLSPLPARAAMFANQHGLFPQAFMWGFLFTYSRAIVRFAYLCGQISAVGWWWYFPFAILVKTPIATLLAAVIAGYVAFRGVSKNQFRDRARQWTVVCLTVPVILFMASAMMSNLNIGLRHILSIYPFVFVAIGCVTAAKWRTGGRKTHVIIVALGIMLATESLSAYPNFIPYFNVIASNLPGGKLSLLGDSNLDWGQDLPLLAKWQHEHPQQKLYLSYFGYADPAYFGIHYIPLPGGYHYDPPPQWVDPYSRSVIAISASNLQGFLEDPELRRTFYDQWKSRKPIAVLGDSIYLFSYDPSRRNPE